MSTTLKTVLALGLFTVVAACQQEEPKEMAPPVMEEKPMSKY